MRSLATTCSTSRRLSFKYQRAYTRPAGMKRRPLWLAGSASECGALLRQVARRGAKYSAMQNLEISLLMRSSLSLHW